MSFNKFRGSRDDLRIEAVDNGFLIRYEYKIIENFDTEYKTVYKYFSSEQVDELLAEAKQYMLLPSKD